METEGEIVDASQCAYDIATQPNFREVSSLRPQSSESSISTALDSLPGLPDWHLFNDRVGQAILLARRHRTQAAVLMLSLSGLIEVADSPGYTASNELLQCASREIQRCLRTHDSMTQLGSDTFLILMQDIQQPEDVAAAANRVQKALASVFSSSGREPHPAAAIGVCIYPDDGLDAGTLINRAETAMQVEKKHGRHNCNFYRADFDSGALSPESIEQGLFHALERNELVVHYQPKFELKTGNISGVEALARWRHPTHGSIPAGKFIPIAEKSCLILPIGAWVLREVSDQTRAWAKSGMPAKPIAVNISPTEFQGEHFLESLSSILSGTDLAPESLELDISLAALMRHPGRSAFILETLRDQEIHVSVDNFGTGQFNPAILDELPLFAIKIDRHAIGQITTSTDGAANVKAIIQLGRRLNLRVIAEGVEKAEDMEFLWAHDCDEAQGNFLSKTMPAEQLASILGLRRRSRRSCLTLGSSEEHA